MMSSGKLYKTGNPQFFEKTDLMDEKELRTVARLLFVALQDFYDWCAKDYPGWPAVEVALKKAKDVGLTDDT